MRQKRKRIRKEKNIYNEENSVKSFLIIIIVILGGLGVVYLFTLLAQNNGLFDSGYNKPTIEESSISYTNISYGTIFDRNEDEYYVLISNSESSEYIYLSSILSKYIDKEDSLPVYIVDTNDAFNKNIIGEDDNADANNSQDIRVKDYALIKINDGENIKYLTDIDEINEELD